MVLPKAFGGIYVPDDRPADTIEVFEALCWARGHLWREGHLGEDIQRAVDPLSRWAAEHGLVERIGQDDVQRLIAEAFHD
jgi:hypothetical protein